MREICKLTVPSDLEGMYVVQQALGGHAQLK